jgi:hypothetical protein
MDERQIRRVLRHSWSLQTSTKWTSENPAAGQCAVTALVINDRFGGSILKTRTGDLWHFYNEIDGRRVDLTAEQFPEPLRYADIPSSREEAFEDATQAQYRILTERIQEEFA